MRLIRGLAAAFSSFSRIPVPGADWSGQDGNCVLAFLPLVGAVTGGAVWLWLLLCGRLGFSPLLRGAVAAAVPVLLSGGIHMDGFLDVSDALASWQPPEKRLEILKDSHAGAGAVTACGVYFLLSAAVLGEAPVEEGLSLALCFVASRSAAAWTSVVLKGARPGGMLDHFTRTADRKAVSAACALALAVCAAVWVLRLGGRGILPVLALGFCVFMYRRMAYRSFGGVTGDLAGWLVQVSELCMAAAVAVGGKL